MRYLWIAAIPLAYSLSCCKPHLEQVAHSEEKGYYECTLCYIQQDGTLYEPLRVFTFLNDSLVCSESIWILKGKRWLG